MSLINVCIKKDNNMTSISNSFIRDYMPKANASYVKIYLYMLMLSSTSEAIDIEHVASALDVFESEVIKVLTTLSKEGYCTFKKDGDNFTFSPEITSKNFKSEMTASKSIEKVPYFEDLNNDNSTFSIELPLKNTQFISNEIEHVFDSISTIAENNDELKSKKTSYSPDELALVLQYNDEIKDVMNFIETNYGCTFSPNNLESLVSICEAEYVSNDCLNTIISYIYKNKSVSKISSVLKTLETLAISLNEKGITNKEDVENYLNSSSKNYMQIFKHLGITGRIASDVEKKYIDKWLYEYKMPLSLILEACDKTMLSINEPSFKYIEKIISSCRDKNINTLNDLNKTAQMPNYSHITPSKKSKFANYNEEKNNYDNFDAENTNYLLKKYGNI